MLNEGVHTVTPVSSWLETRWPQRQQWIVGPEMTQRSPTQISRPQVLQSADSVDSVQYGTSMMVLGGYKLHVILFSLLLLTSVTNFPLMLWPRHREG
jgi:hypothetical protein